MPWFVPTQGDSELMAVRASSLSQLSNPSDRRLALASRLESLCRESLKPDQAAAMVGERLVEGGVLDTPPTSVADLAAEIESSDLLDEALRLNGLGSPYRRARPNEVQAIEELDAEGWAAHLSLHDLT